MILINKIVYYKYLFRKGGFFINTEWLKYLLITAQSRSLNEAAKKCYITRQSLNTAITNLEKELNLKIFNRHHSGVCLTEDGHLVVNAAQEILAQIDMLKSLHPKNVSTKIHSDNLNIYIAPVMNYYFSQKISSVLFSENIQLHLQTLDADICLQSYHKGLTEDGMYFINIFDENDIIPIYENEDFICTLIMDDYLVVLLAQNHELAQYKTVSVASLLKYQLATLQTSASEKCPYRCIFSKNAQPEINICTDNIFTYIDAIKKKISISPISAFMYKQSAILFQDSEILNIQLKPKVKFKLYCFYSKEYYAQHTESVEFLFTILKQTINEL